MTTQHLDQATQLAPVIGLFGHSVGVRLAG